jgi:tetratricopeptide (TPR) repeat protein
VGNWHPLTWLSHLLDCQLYGLKPAGHHVTNLVLHLGNTLLLFAVLLRLMHIAARHTRKREPLQPAIAASGADAPRNLQDARVWGAAFVAALFAVHPLHVESVAWVAERKDVLSTFFFLLSLWCYTRFAEGRLVEDQTPTAAGADAARPGQTRARRAYALGLGFFALGLMSKPMVVTLPAVLLLLDWWPLGRWSRPNLKRLLVEKIPFFALSAGAAAVTFLAQKGAGAVAPLWGFTLGQRLANALVSYVRYLRKTFWPSDLAAFYPHPGTWPVWQVLGAGALLALVTVLALRQARRRPWLLAGWLWFLGTLVPVIGLVQVGMQSMADRYSYIPLIGVFVILAGLLAELVGRWPRLRAVWGGLAVVAVAACVAVTRTQWPHWENAETLFTHALRVTKNNEVAHNSLGGVRFRQGRIEEAIAHFREAVRLSPGYATAHNNLGVLLTERGELEAGVSHLQKALRLDPKYVDAYNNLGLALLRRGNTNEGVACFETALQLDVARPHPCNNLATVLCERGEFERAVAVCRTTLRQVKDFPDLWLRLASALAATGRTNDAIAELREALRFNPEDAALHNSLGSFLLGLGRRDEAIVQFREALRLRPTFADARNNLGLALAQQGLLDEAITEYREALRHATNHAALLNNLGLALAERGRWDEAAAQFEAALRAQPDLAQAHFNLGNARMAQNRPAEAVEHYTRAVRAKTNHAAALCRLGVALAMLGRLAEAETNLVESLRINPGDTTAHNELAVVLARQGKFDPAVQHFEEAARFGADPAVAQNHIGRARAAQGRYAEAAQHYRRALEIRPDFAEALNNLAWLLATCPDASIRNGAEAVRLAQRAVELTQRRDAGKLDTLAAALAEAGDFNAAVATAGEALGLAETQHQDGLAGEIRARLHEFESRRPHRQPGG